MITSRHTSKDARLDCDPARGPGRCGRRRCCLGRYQLDGPAERRARVPRAGGEPAARRGSGARRRRLVHGAGIGRARLARPEDRQDEACRPRRRFSAARCHRRSRRRPVDHGRRAQRDRPGRPEDEARPPLPVARLVGLRQPEHGGLRPPRRPLVHGAERDLRAARPARRQGAGLQGAARRRPVRDHGDAVRRRLLRVPRRQLPRPYRRRPFHRPRAAAADARPGRAAGVVGLEGADLGQRVERRQGRRLRRLPPGAGASGASRARRRCRMRSTSTTRTSSG